MSDSSGNWFRKLFQRGAQSKADLVDPDIRSLINESIGLAALGRHEDALHCLNAALDLDPRNAWTFSHFFVLGEFPEEALVCFEKDLKLNPHHVYCIFDWNNKGDCLYALGRYEEAISCYDRALELDPRNVIACTKRVSSLHILGRHEEAIHCRDEALELDPHLPVAWYKIARASEGLGEYKGAIYYYDQVLELDPRNVDAWYNRALAEDKLSQWQEAIRSYQQFLERDPAQCYVEQIEYAHKRLQELAK